MMSSQISKWGHPRPGASPTPHDATAPHFFVDNDTWETIIQGRQFDDIVVGTGFCAWAYVTEALKRDPFRKILMLERGDFWLPDHVQNLPLPFKKVFGGPASMFPWSLSSKTFNSPELELKFVAPILPFFGGRSLYWSAWCPCPSPTLMRDFPPSMLETAQSAGFWENAKKLLNVVPADQIDDGVYGDLQMAMDHRLKSSLDDIESISFFEPAPLAVGNPSLSSRKRFYKFATPGLLLQLQERQEELHRKQKGSPLLIATNVAVQKLHVAEGDDCKVASLDTSRGTLRFPSKETNVILAAGVIPNTTILLNSLPSMQGRAGSRMVGHFMSHIEARFPIDAEMKKILKPQGLQISASRIAGKDKDTGMQFHIQITTIYSPNPDLDAEDAARENTDYAASATLEQFRGSENHIIVVLQGLAEIEENNPDSWLKLDPQSSDPTSNIIVQAVLTDNDKKLWDVMDKAIFDTISVVAGSAGPEVEFWHKGAEATPGSWQSTKPTPQGIREPVFGHEASTLYIGDYETSTAALDDEYRPYGSKNVYVTGAALFPTAGSWNPVLTACAYTQDLARRVVKERA